MESNQYKNKEIKKVITPAVLNKAIFRSLFLQESFNYERMQACGWLYSLVPGLELIHTDKEDLAKSMKMHLEFFNTHPFLVNFIQGVVLAMEENKEDISTIRGFKVATMGPLGGIGDSIFWLTVLPIAGGIGASFATQGNVLGPILFFVIFFGVQMILRYFLGHYGYKLGVTAISTLKENTERFSRAATIVGVLVVGALVASYININVVKTIQVGAASVAIQEVLDKIIPKFLPIVYTFTMYKLIKRKVSATSLILLTVVLGVALHYLGIL